MYILMKFFNVSFFLFFFFFGGGTSSGVSTVSKQCFLTERMSPDCSSNSFSSSNDVERAVGSCSRTRYRHWSVGDLKRKKKSKMPMGHGNVSSYLNISFLCVS